MYSFIQKSAAVRFVEYADNSAGVERLRQEGETSRLRGKTGDIILLDVPGISCFGRRENKIWARVGLGPVIVISCRTRAGLGPERLGPGPS